MKTKRTQIILFLFISIVSIAIDQYTKYLAVIRLKDKPAFSLLSNILEFLYSENRGAAFGILQGKYIFFYLVTILVCLFIVFVILKIPTDNRYLFLLLTLSFIFSGALGNFIDRIKQNYVVDFIYFKPIDFPIFNVADIYVSVSTIVLMLLMIFYYKDEEFNFIKNGKKNADN